MFVAILCSVIFVQWKQAQELKYQVRLLKHIMNVRTEALQKCDDDLYKHQNHKP